jgi:hypothetical protein
MPVCTNINHFTILHSLDTNHEERGLIPDIISGCDISMVKAYTLPAMEKITERYVGTSHSAKQTTPTHSWS